MDTDQEMIDWNTRWTLIGGLVICPSCLRGQPVSESDLPFRHEPECKARTDRDQQPWGSLHDILDRAQG